MIHKAKTQNREYEQYIPSELGNLQNHDTCLSDNHLKELCILMFESNSMNRAWLKSFWRWNYFLHRLVKESPLWLTGETYQLSSGTTYSTSWLVCTVQHSCRNCKRTEGFTNPSPQHLSENLMDSDMEPSVSDYRLNNYNGYHYRQNWVHCTRYRHGS